MNFNPPILAQMSKVQPKAQSKNLPKVPPSADYDLGEARTYDGAAAADLANFALDMAAAKKGVRRDGLYERIKIATLDFFEAFDTYKRVKAALRLFFKPIAPRAVEMPKQSAPAQTKPKPRPKIIWRGYRPQPKDWAELDAHFGYDVRATSPTWIEKRVKAARRKARAALASAPLNDKTPKDKPVKTERPTEIRDTEIRDYVDPGDLHMIWPPIHLPELNAETSSQPQDTETITMETTALPLGKVSSLRPALPEPSDFISTTAPFMTAERLTKPSGNRRARRKAAKQDRLSQSRAPPFL